MKMLITDAYIAIGDITKEQMVDIKSIFTFKDMSKAMTSNGFNKRKVKSVCFARQKGKALIIRTGFLKELFKFIKAESMPVESIQDKRTKLFNTKLSDDEIRTYFDPDFEYISHQIRAIKALLKTNVGIIKAPTSAGKTEIIIALIKISKLPTLILVDSVSLATQTLKRLHDADVSCGICHGKGKADGEHMIATIGSYKKLGDLTRYKMVIIDECHIVGSARFQEFFETTNYPYRYGFSATPDGSKDKYRYATIRQHIGGEISEIFTKELIENEVMVAPKITFKKVFCIPTPSWDSAYEKCIASNKERNKIVVDIVKKHNKQTLVLFKLIKHGETLKEEFPDAILLSGKDSNTIREAAIEKFKSGEIKILIASGIFTQGISINNIEVLINVAGGKSKKEVLQRIGRALRLYKGKDYALVYDFYDEGNKFTERHSLQREKSYRDAGFEDITYD